MARWHRLLVGCALLAGAPSASAAPPTAEGAQKLLAASDYAGAAKAYGSLAKANPKDGAAQFGLGSAEMGRGRLEAAAAAFARSAELGFRPLISHYNRACALARSSPPSVDAAFAALDQAFAGGTPVPPSALTADPDLAALHADPRFQALVDRVDAGAHPCAHDPRYAAFDYWVGTFDVTSPGGQKLGTNTITREQNGCVLVERWTDGYGETGTSLSFLVPSATPGQPDGWRQLWVDASGRVADYRGAMEAPGKVVMVATVVDPRGAVSRSRGTWTAEPDGTVRQVFESLDEAGASTGVTFDGVYTRTRPASTGTTP